MNQKQEKPTTSPLGIRIRVKQTKETESSNTGNNIFSYNTRPSPGGFSFGANASNGGKDSSFSFAKSTGSTKKILVLPTQNQIPVFGQPPPMQVVKVRDEVNTANLLKQKSTPPPSKPVELQVKPTPSSDGSKATPGEKIQVDSKVLLTPPANSQEHRTCATKLEQLGAENAQLKASNKELMTKKRALRNIALKYKKQFEALKQKSENAAFGREKLLKAQVHTLQRKITILNAQKLRAESLLQREREPELQAAGWAKNMQQLGESTAKYAELTETINKSTTERKAALENIYKALHLAEKGFGSIEPNVEEAPDDSMEPKKLTEPV